MPQDMQERMDQSRAFFERLRNAGSPEERTKIMAERTAWERTSCVSPPLVPEKCDNLYRIMLTHAGGYLK
jgi:hypothetical protein